MEEKGESGEKASKEGLRLLAFCRGGCLKKVDFLWWKKRKCRESGSYAAFRQRGGSSPSLPSHKNVREEFKKSESKKETVVNDVYSQRPCQIISRTLKGSGPSRRRWRLQNETRRHFPAICRSVYGHFLSEFPQEIRQTRTLPLFNLPHILTADKQRLHNGFDAVAQPICCETNTSGSGSLPASYEIVPVLFYLCVFFRTAGYFMVARWVRHKNNNNNKKT